MAVEDAKEKAKGLAGAAGISLGKIMNISENQGVSPIRAYAVPAGAGSDMALEKNVTQPEIQPGQTEINVTVSLSYEIR